jgi:type VI secretion system protein ImpA
MTESAKTLQVNLETLLAPIAPDAPAGPSLRYDGIYDRIREARREEDPSLPQGVWKTAVKAADWGEVIALGTEALGASKDLMIAGWLLEAWTALHKLRGLDVGLRLLAGLSERFWDTAHPAIEQDDPAARLAVFEWIDDKVSYRLRWVPITQPEGPNQTPYSLNDWDTRPGAASMATSQAQVMTSASLTPPSHFAALHADFARASDALALLERTIAKQLAGAIVSFSKIKRTLGKIKTLLGRLNSAFAGEDTAVPEEEAPRREDEPRRAEEAPIRCRADAYQRLIEASDYLLRTEPHSPTPYLVKRAIAWGDMSLAKLLREIIMTPQDLKAIFSLLGIKEGE